MHKVVDILHKMRIIQQMATIQRDSTSDLLYDMTVQDVALATKSAASSVRNWVRDGKLSAIRTASGMRLFRRLDVDRFIAERAAKVQRTAKNVTAA